MKRRMPSHVRVSPHTYRVILKPASQMTRTEGRADLGYTVFDRNEIWIKKGQKRSKQQEILWHEVKHTCTYPDLIGKRATDEEFIDHTSPKELGVMQDNPELLAYLQEK